MSKTYIQMVNEVLTELTEVNLSSSTFAAATNIQKYVKDSLNRAYFDICAAHYSWPFLADGASIEPFYGNNYVETVAGTRWYLLNPSRTGKDDDFSYVDWDRFEITEAGVSGETVPHTTGRLRFVDNDLWMRYFKSSEDADLYSETFMGGTPLRVIRNPDGYRFGLSPVPDKVYRIYFFAYNQPTALSGESDQLPIPDRYVPVVLARTRYYAWQNKENYQQAGFAADDYQKGLRKMREELLEQAPDFFSDDRCLVY